jgi:hypothetical protein
MFELERAISEWRGELRSRGINGAETLDELESHLRDDLEEQARSGMEIQRAFDAARGRIGQSDSLGLEFKKIRFAELFRELKDALLTLIGVPSYNLITNMNASFSSPEVEARWATYVKTATFLAPSLILWMFSCLFMMPKLKQICGNAGLALPNVLGLALFATSHFVLISAALLTSLILLEWRSNKWPRYRRVTLGTGVFIINAFILLLITLMVFSALVAAPAMAHPAK